MNATTKLFLVTILFLAAACAALMGGGSASSPIAVPLPVEETPIGRVTGGLQKLADVLNTANQDGTVTPEETAAISAALTGFGQTMVESVRALETSVRAELKQAQESGGGIDWPSTLLQVGVSTLLGGGLGFQIVRKAPNRTFLGTEPDPDVARVAGQHPPNPT